MQMLEFLSTVLTFHKNVLESKQIHVKSMLYRQHHANSNYLDYLASGDQTRVLTNGKPPARTVY